MEELQTLVDDILGETRATQREKPYDPSRKLELLMRSNKKETKSVYLSEINAFLIFAKGKVLDEWTVREFFEYLENKGTSRSYQRNCWFALKKYFKANGLPWVLETEDFPKLERNKIKKITLSEAEIISMIEAVKNNGYREERVLLALTATYGLRCVEFCSLTEKDLNRKEHFLHVQAKKGGEERFHLVPEEIKSWIYPWKFSQEIAKSTALSWFDTILQRAKIEKVRGMGIHAIRRGLFTALCSTGLPLMRIYDFGKWKKQAQLGMLAEYDNPDFKKVDLLLFEKHPFLSYFN